MKVKGAVTQWATSVALVVLGASFAATQAPQDPPPAAAGQPPAGPGGRGRGPQALVPVAASTLAANPDAYVGMTVTLTAAVDQRYGSTAFTVDQDRSKTGADVLVLAPLLNAPVEPNAYVTVIGEVVRFEAADAAARMKESMPVLAADVAAKYRGRPAIIATSVINGAMTDLAKRLPPPISPEELALSKVMKQIGPGFNALRQSVTAANATDTVAQAAALKKGFAEAAVFWKSQARPDAIQWTEDARAASDAVESAAAKGDWDAVKAAVPKLQGACASCHGLYRERFDDGTYRFKPPGK